MRQSEGEKTYKIFEDLVADEPQFLYECFVSKIGVHDFFGRQGFKVFDVFWISLFSL